MSFLHPLVAVMLQVGKPGCQCIVKQVHHVLIHGSLVGFERQHATGRPAF